MTPTHCLNCNEVLTAQFCSGCGQKADTHRISLKHFLYHDVLHGTFHIDKGMLFTAREAMIRPGQAALDYIAGKRKRYYNVFYLILIVTGLMLFFRHFYMELVHERDFIPNKRVLSGASKTIDEFISQKSKFIIFLFVPFGALNSWILFQRKKLNLSEHAIISGMVLLGILLLSTLGNLLFYIDVVLEFNEIASNTVTYATITAIFVYIGYAYINAFKADYAVWGLTWRIVSFFLLIFFELYLLLFLLVGYATNWKMGPVTITPFG